MRGQLLFDNEITTKEAHRRICEALEQHRSTILALESQIEELKAESLFRQDCILALNSQYNEYAPISRLPPEVLCNVFSFAQRRDSGDMLPYSKWTGLTHVSRYWRDVSINSPSLWTEPHFGNEQWFSEAVRRSKNVGLVFNIAGSSREHWAGLKYALQYTSFIRGLRILDSPSLSVWNRILHALPQSSSRLEFLHIMVVDADDARYKNTFQNRTLHSFIKLPDDALWKTVRQLRNLQLLECHIDWKSPLLFQPAVTHLTLRDLASKPTWKQFIRAMKEMPALEYLTLDDTFLIADQTYVPEWTPQDHIHFASLRVLDIILSNTPLEIEAIFHLITFPPSAIVKVICFAEHPSSTEFSRIITNLGRSYSTRLFDASFQTFLLFLPDYHSDDDKHSGLWLMFSMDTYSRKQLIYGDIDDANLQLHFFWEKQLLDGLDVNPLLTTIFDGSESLPIQRVQHIYLGLDPEQNKIDAEILLNTIGKLTELNTVATRCTASKPFIDAMELGLTTQDTAPSDSVALLYFPKLSSICFHDTRITNSKSAPNPVAVPIELLLDCLIRRYKYGAKLPNVSFTECHGLGREGAAHLLDESMAKAKFTPSIQL